MNGLTFQDCSEVECLIRDPPFGHQSRHTHQPAELVQLSQLPLWSDISCSEFAVGIFRKRNIAAEGKYTSGICFIAKFLGEETEV